MIHSLIISADKKWLSVISSMFQRKGDVFVLEAESGETGISMIKENHFDLVVADEQLPDMSGLDFIKKLIRVNPMSNCAAVSGLSHEDFHEASEGLGVLMQLPLDLKEEHVESLMARFNKIAKVTGANFK